MKNFLLVPLVVLSVPAMCQTIDAPTNQQEQSQLDILHGTDTPDEGKPETAAEYFQRRQREADGALRDVNHATFRAIAPDEFKRRLLEQSEQATRQAVAITSQPFDTGPDNFAKSRSAASLGLPAIAVDADGKTFAQRVMEDRARFDSVMMPEAREVEVPAGAKIVALALLLTILAGFAIAWRARRAIRSAFISFVVMVGAGAIIVVRRTMTLGARLRSAMIARADAHTGSDE